MAKATRIIVDLQCTQCKELNYQTTKNTKPKSGKKNTPLELNKFCPRCKHHTLHKETK